MKSKIKKYSIVSTLLTLTICNVAFAKHGNGGGNGHGNNPKPGTPTSGSAAFFVSEAGEHAMRVISAENPVNQNNVIYSNTSFNDTAKTANVIIEFRDGAKREFNCSLSQSSSNSGSVTKPEMHCSNTTTESGYWSFKPYSKTSNAGLISESVEHAIRLVVSANNSLEKSIKGSDARLDEKSKSVAVTLFLMDNSQKSFKCSLVDHPSHGGSVMKKEMICFNQ